MILFIHQNIMEKAIIKVIKKTNTKATHHLWIYTALYFDILREVKTTKQKSQ